MVFRRERRAAALRDRRLTIHVDLSAFSCTSLRMKDMNQNSLNNAHLAAIVTSADDAILSKTLEGVITSWNPGAERMFGYSAEEMIGQLVLRLIPPERQTEEDEILARLRAGERIEHYETVRRKKDGTLINVSLTISPMRDQSGDIIGASKIIRDIPDRKRME